MESVLLGYIDAFDEILEYEKKTGIVFDTIIDAVGSVELILVYI